MTEAIIVAIITAVVTLVGGYFATTEQRKKDTVTAEIETKKLKVELERELWERLQEELQKLADDLADENKKRRALESKIDAQESAHKKEIQVLTQRIRDLEKLLNDKDKRINELEQENGKLKNGNTGRRI